MRNLIKVYLAMHNLSQTDMAHGVGVSRQSLNKIIHGWTDPSALTMLRITKFFNESDPLKIFPVTDEEIAVFVTVDKFKSPGHNNREVV